MARKAAPKKKPAPKQKVNVRPKAKAVSKAKAKPRARARVTTKSKVNVKAKSKAAAKAKPAAKSKAAAKAKRSERATVGEQRIGLEKPTMNRNQLANTPAVAPGAVKDRDTDRPIVAPPAGFEQPTTWKAIAAAWSGALEIFGLAKQAKAAEPATVAKNLGIAALPPSYLEFISRFYPLGELRKKYQRATFPYFLDILAPARLVDERDFFEMGLASSANVNAELGQAAKNLSGLLPFGSDTSRVSICWDPKQTNADGEMLICFVDRDEPSADKARADVGYDLKEIVKYYQPRTFDELDCLTAWSIQSYKLSTRLISIHRL
jgi:hypothetical protein